MDAIWTQQGQPPLVRARVRRCEPWARHSLHLCTYDLRLRAALHWHELLFFVLDLTRLLFATSPTVLIERVATLRQVAASAMTR